MADQPTRTLATIVSIDAAGYSAAAERDDEQAVDAVAGLRARVSEIAADHHGRVFNTAGDGIMLEFASADAALRAVLVMLADAIVTASRARIGMHVGDVRRMADGDLLGHGVNVAARLQALASPGAAVASAALIDLVRGQITHGLASLGRVRLDKMDETVEVFVLSLKGDPVIKPSSAFRRAAARAYPVWALPLAIAIAAIGVSVAISLIWTTWPAATTPQSVAEASVIGPHSVAVLPFENLSADRDNAFFAVGIQDEILTRLTKIGSLRVISRTSTAHLASHPENLLAIAKQLGVAYVLEGTVQRSGDVVRINVQLIDGATDNHTWAEVYDRKLTDIFRTQSDVAVAVANALSATVTGEERKAIAIVPTANPAAYDAYLRGLALARTSGHYNLSNLKSAEDSLNDAVRLDPKFALAWALLTRVHAVETRDDISNTHRQGSRIAMETALRLGASLPEVQLAQGFYRYYAEEDYAGARQIFEKVSALWPNDVETIAALGYIARRQNRWTEGASYLARAVSLDPQRADLREEMLFTLVAARDYPSALRAANDALNIWPHDAHFHAKKAQIFQLQGDLDAADAVLKPLVPHAENSDVWQTISSQAMLRRQPGRAVAQVKALLDQKPDVSTAADINMYVGDLLRQSGDSAEAATSYRDALKYYLEEVRKQPDRNAIAFATLAWVYCGLEDRERALKYADDAVRMSPAAKDAVDGPFVETNRAYIWARLGDRDRAIPSIERLLVMPASNLTPAILRLDPELDKLRGDPRFEALARRDVK